MDGSKTTIRRQRLGIVDDFKERVSLCCPCLVRALRQIVNYLDKPGAYLDIAHDRWQWYLQNIAAEAYCWNPIRHGEKAKAVAFSRNIARPGFQRNRRGFDHG